MSQNHETGHAVNASNFVERVSVTLKHENEYKPTNPEIMTQSLIPVKDMVILAIEGVKTCYNLLSAAIANRKLLYEKMDTTASRAINMLSSSNAQPSQIEQAKALYKKYKSVRSSEVPTEEEVKTKAAKAGVEPVIPKKRSTSEQGHVKRLDHFKSLVTYLKMIDAYKPVESDLTVEGLTALANSVDAINRECNLRSHDWRQAIRHRDKLMYGEPKGAHALSTKLQAYVLATHGKDSQFYKELLQFPVRNG